MLLYVKNPVKDSYMLPSIAKFINPASASSEFMEALGINDWLYAEFSIGVVIPLKPVY